MIANLPTGSPLWALVNAGPECGECNGLRFKTYCPTDVCGWELIYCQSCNAAGKLVQLKEARRLHLEDEASW
jgi:hypothetical protein